MKRIWKDIGGFILGVIVAIVLVGSLFAGCSRVTQDDTIQNIDNNNQVQIQQRDLVIGSQGADVWDLHQQLYALMPNDIIKELATTDEFSETTQFYVMLFQLSQDLEPTGVVDMTTRETLNSDPTVPTEQELMELKLFIPIDENVKNITESEMESGEMQELSTKGNVAYLTFDDGPNPTYTPQIIDILKKYNASATFFALGQEVDKFPTTIKNASSKENVFANHTYSHINIATASEKTIQDEIVKANEAVRNVTGKTPICFRPPYGAINPDVKQKIGETGGKTIMWDVDTQDWAKPGTEAIVNHVLEYTQNGEIILMHDGGGDRTQTVSALETILKKMTAEGWEFRALDCVR